MGGIEHIDGAPAGSNVGRRRKLRNSGSASKSGFAPETCHREPSGIAPIGPDGEAGGTQGRPCPQKYESGLFDHRWVHVDAWRILESKRIYGRVFHDSTVAESRQAR